MSTGYALIDTHALLWHTLDPEKLSPTAAAAMERCERDGGVASSISLWELAIKTKRGMLSLPLSVKAYAERLATLRWLRLAPVDVSTWLASVELDWSHRDPADRVIVATASASGLPIITKDVVIRDFYGQCVW